MDVSIKLKPEILMNQASEMNTLMQEYETLFSKTTGILNNTNANWSANLANNFAGKILSAQKGFSSVVDVLGFGMGVAKNSAEKFSNFDASMAKAIDEVHDAGKSVLKKTVGGAGIIGGAVSVGWSLSEHMGDIINGNKNQKISAVGGLTKDLYSTVKLLNTTITNTQKCERLFRMLPGQAMKTGVERAFGLSKISTLFKNPPVFKGSIAGNPFTRFKQNMHHLDTLKDKYTAGGMKSALAWTGTALDLACNGISNYQEMKEGKISKKRAVAETVTETAIDIGKDWLIGTAVTAGLAAAGMASAPVVAVAAGTALVSYGLDWTCQKLTKKFLGEEKKLTEFVSDTVIDTSKYVYNKGKEVVKKAGKAVGKATKAAVKKAGKICSKIKSFF